MSEHKLYFLETCVTKDGEIIAKCAYPEAAYSWLHDHNSASVDWLLQHEGYAFTQPLIDPEREEIERLSMLEGKEEEIQKLQEHIDHKETVYKIERLQYHQRQAEAWSVGTLCWVKGGPGRIERLKVDCRYVLVTLRMADGTTYEANLERQVTAATAEGIAGLLKYRHENAGKPWGSRWDQDVQITRTLLQWQYELKLKSASKV